VSGTQFLQDGAPVTELMQGGGKEAEQRSFAGNKRPLASWKFAKISLVGKKGEQTVVCRFLHTASRIRYRLCAADYSWRAISLPNLPVAQFPNLAPPQVVVSSNYIGANAQAWNPP